MARSLSILFRSSGSRDFLPLTLIHITLGFFFFASGFNKVFVVANQAAMLQTLTEAGIPFPAFMAIFVALCEMCAGLLLAIGLLSRLCACVLGCISVVALLTVGLHQIPTGLNALSWFSWLFYLPESGYILMCLLLIVQGSGPVSLDRLIAKKAEQRKVRQD